MGHEYSRRYLGWGCNMKVAMLAPPWLAIPPVGYGGIENVLAVLVPELMKLGVDVELFTVGATTVQATKNHWLYDIEQYPYVREPMYDALPVAMAQLIFSLNAVKAAGDFDIIHSHNNTYVDLMASLYSGGNLPPFLHTLHGPPFTTQDQLNLNIPDNLPMWREIARTNSENMYLVPISHALMQAAPAELQQRSVPPVHNGIDLAEFPFVTDKSDYFMTLARSHPNKGQAIAIRACLKLGYKLKLAGVVGSLTRPKEVMLELANPLSQYRSLIDFRYFSDEIFPHLDGDMIDYVGDLNGERKMQLLSHARALLFPIQWNEPFGMVALEALACGTPVVAMARGALPEIIQHGSNGFLANNEKEFQQYMRRVDEIDPAACRKSVEDKFSARHMAQEYLKRYQLIIDKHASKNTAVQKPRRTRARV